MNQKYFRKKALMENGSRIKELLQTTRSGKSPVDNGRESLNRDFYEYVKGVTESWKQN